MWTLHRAVVSTTTMVSRLTTHHIGEHWQSEITEDCAQFRTESTTKITKGGAKNTNTLCVICSLFVIFVVNLPRRIVHSLQITNRVIDLRCGKLNIL
jgi:hypothetical protein